MKVLTQLRSKRLVPLVACMTAENGGPVSSWGLKNQ